MKVWREKYPDRGSPDDAVKVWEKANLAMALEMNLVSSALASPAPEQESVSAVEEEDSSSPAPTVVTVVGGPQPSGPRAGGGLEETLEPASLTEAESFRPSSSPASAAASSSLLSAVVPSRSDTGDASTAPETALTESLSSPLAALVGEAVSPLLTLTRSPVRSPMVGPSSSSSSQSAGPRTGEFLDISPVLPRTRRRLRRPARYASDDEEVGEAEPVVPCLEEGAEPSPSKRRRRRSDASLAIAVAGALSSAVIAEGPISWSPPPVASPLPEASSSDDKPLAPPHAARPPVLSPRTLQRPIPALPVAGGSSSPVLSRAGVGLGPSSSDSVEERCEFVLEAREACWNEGTTPLFLHRLGQPDAFRGPSVSF